MVLPTNGEKPPAAAEAVLRPSIPVPEGAVEVKGIEFDDYRDAPVTVEQLIEGMSAMGFQASAVFEATAAINDMIRWHDPENSESRTTIFLGYTSNLVSSGMREIIRYLVQHKHVSAIVTSAGGVEEDLIKCLAPTYLGTFSAVGATLREQGLNRIGNLFVPNDNYCKFEDWIVPIFDKMLKEQELSRTESAARNKTNGAGPDHPDFEAPFVWTPSTMIRRLGDELNDDRSICTWAARNNIPIFCPALTDGSLGDMLYFHSYKASPQELTIDIGKDIRKINDIALKAKHSGMIILGGGVVKHHIANANLMRNGADVAVYINTANEFDGSDAGAKPDEAVSWGKIRSDAKSVKVYAEATIVFPMIVAATFARTQREGAARAILSNGHKSSP